jgi:SOS-response transcriptional repressor LexA
VGDEHRLTGPRLRVFLAVRDYMVRTGGQSPTVRELQSALEYRSPNAVVTHLLALDRAGLVVFRHAKGPVRTRGLQIPGLAEAVGPAIGTHFDDLLRRAAQGSLP